MIRLMLLFFCLNASYAQAPALEEAFRRTAARFPGQTGVAAIHLETGRMASVRGSDWFYAASTRKIAIAAQTLSLVDEGKEKLGRMVEIRVGDLSPGSSTLTSLVNQPGLALSIRNLLELMMTVSDNTATDILLREGGGPAAVMARLRSKGLTSVRVDRPTYISTSQFNGLDEVPENHPPDLLRRLFDAVPESKRQAALNRFLTDERDSTTPEGMARLLVALAQGKVLSPDSTALLFDIMGRCQGDTRLKGLLPAGTPVPHKTGSMGAWIVADAGVITLPEGRGRVAVAAFTKGGDSLPLAERTIAEFARSAYDYFLFQGRE